LNQFGFGGEALKEFGADDECAGGDSHATFDAAAALSFFDQLDESGVFEFAQVVVDFLAREAESFCETGCGIGVIEASEYVAPNG